MKCVYMTNEKVVAKGGELVVARGVPADMNGLDENGGRGHA